MRQLSDQTANERGPAASRGCRHAPRRAFLLALPLAMLCPLLYDGAAVAQPTETIGQVVRQQGSVIALREAGPRALHLGAAIHRHDRIVTGPEAKIEVEFADGSTLSVGASSDVEVTDYAPTGDKRGSLTVLFGIIRTNLAGLWSGGFEVRTRAAIASVRSTDWVTEASAQRSSVFVVEGRVAVRATAGGAEVVLAESFGTDVEAGGPPAPPKEWGRARVEDVLARTQVP